LILKSKKLGEIEKLNSDIGLIHLTIEQLNKDLSFTGFEIIFSGNKSSALAEILKRLEDCILQIQKRNSSLLQTWMYRVDIPENVFKQILNSDKPESRLAKAIIERTFIKVMFKKKSKENL
jgi:hypothetical protein